MDILDLRTPSGRFRLVAVIEAITWAALLVGMFLKYVAGVGEGGVPVIGAIHGGAFVAYVLVTLLVVRPLRWRVTTTLLALVASVPPFGSIVLERWATRSGRLAPPSAATSGKLSR